MNIKSDNVCHTLGKLLVLNRLEFPSLLVPLIFHPGVKRLKPWLLSWFIFGVNLNGLKDAQRAETEVFLGVSVRVFPEELGMWVNGAEGKICTQCWQAPRRKRQRENFLSLSLSLQKVGCSSSPALEHKNSRIPSLWTPDLHSNLPHYPLVLKPSVLN